MGNCLSTPGVNGGFGKGVGASAGQQQQQHKAGSKQAHDSVHSLDTAGGRDAGGQHGKWGGKQQQHATNSSNSNKSGKGRQPSAQLSSTGSHNSSSSSSSSGAVAKKRKPPGIDLATGRAIPDFNVNGVLDVLHELGSGGSGTTYLCRDLATSKLVAVKFVPRPLPKAAVPLMMAEVELQAQLGEGHVNIITMRELILTRTHLGLAMDYASGGALTHRVSDLWESALTRGGLHMEEQEACYYLRQFISAMDYLHQHKVAHRDLKLDNTLLEDRLGPAYVRICDFGFAKAWTGAVDNMKTAIGTPVYMSPQMLAAKQCASGYSGVKADVWAAGVLLFVMLLGAFPFDHAENLDPNSRQASNEVWLRQQAPGGWRKHPLAVEALGRQVLSPDCCELLDGLLDMDEEKRLTTAQVLKHPWLQQTLLPDQQRAWEELQAEQQEVTQNIALKSDIYKIRLRKQALTAMLAFSAKPPGRNSLLPQPSSTLSPNASMSGTNNFAAAAAAAVAAADQQQQRQQQPGAAAGLAAGARTDSTPIDAVAGVGSLRSDSIPETAPVNLPAPTLPAAAAAAAAAAGGSASSASDSTAAPAAAAVVDVDAFRAGSETESLPLSADGTTHLSFQAGEGLRSDSLERKVAAYQQQLVDIRNARIAAHAAQDQQQQQPAAAAAVNGGSSAASPFATAAATPAAAASPTSLSPGPTFEAPLQSSSPKQQQQQPQQKTATSSSGTNSTSGSKGGRFNKMFSGSGGSGGRKGKSAAAGGGSGSSGQVQDDEWDDKPDEVWRIPLTSTADPAAYKLSPELSVAAGALLGQLQKGKIEGRGRTNRSSCPVNVSV